MSMIEIISLMSSTGVFAGGIGLLKWGITVERRLMTLEVNNSEHKEG